MAKRYSIAQLEAMAQIALCEASFNNKNVDVVELANLLGYSVFQADFENDIAGKVEKNSNEAIIYINRNDKPERQRFTIAHEIGHILLHHNNNQDIDFIDYRNKGEYSQKEFEADNFPAALLMPKDRSIELWNNLNDVDDFARAISVSRAAASIRLMNLGLI